MTTLEAWWRALLDFVAAIFKGKPFQERTLHRKGLQDEASTMATRAGEVTVVEVPFAQDVASLAALDGLVAASPLVESVGVAAATPVASREICSACCGDGGHNSNCWKCSGSGWIVS